MKKMMTAFVLVAIVALTACNKDVSSEVAVNASIAGKWKLTQVNTGGVWVPYVGTDVIAEFKADGTVTANYDNTTVNAAYKIEGNTITFIQSGQQYAGTYVLNGSQLELSQFLSTSYKGRFTKM
jgi:heat shock protein HslJ